MHHSTALSPDLQAAVDAKLSGPALRGIVAIVGIVREALDAKHLPADTSEVIASLCEDPLNWRIVSFAKSPYAFVRSPVSAAGPSIVSVDLRRIHPSTHRPQGVSAEAWPKLYAAAKRYREAHPVVNGGAR